MYQTGNTKLVKVVLHVTYFFTGMATVLIGQVLPIMASKFSLGDPELSYFFPAQFAGSLTGALGANWFGKRDRYFAATVTGVALIICGIILMSAASFQVCLIGFCVNGLGIGLTLQPINMIVLEMNAHRSASALSVLNFCWGFGAIVCKPFVDLFSTKDALGYTTYFLAVPLALCTLALLPKFTVGGRSQEIADDAPPAPIWTTALAWLIALFNFVHVGFESGMGGWLTTYTTRLPGEPLAPLLSPMVLYFSFFVIGRGIAPVFFRRLNENKMLMLGLVIVLVGSLITLTAGSVLILSIGSLVAGFGTSWIFPTNVARFSQTFGPSASRRSTPLFISGTLGAAVSTWTIGFVSGQTGSLRSGMYVLLIGVVFLIGLQLVLSTVAGRKLRVS